MTRTLSRTALLLAYLGVGTAVAGLTNVDGPGVDMGSAEGADLRAGASESSEVQLYAEQKGVYVGEGEVLVDLLVGDNLAPGDSFVGVPLSFALSDGHWLPAGYYDSALVHYDPIGRQGWLGGVVIELDQPIVALIISDGGEARLLTDSDAWFGNATYEARTRKWDDGSNADFVTLTSPTTLTLDWVQTRYGNVDELRILMRAVLDSDGDGILDADDRCPNTASSDPEAGVPSERLGRQHWADLDGDGTFDTVDNPGRSFTLVETGGCNCADILAARRLGEGLTRFGCPTGVLEEWTR
ncbi:MAG: hypothetical protein EP330_13505 [Deltaproteobacteria bacterium]|nr:MAG: hypothetical protein EP330_13505 [Deltaproteobacteria bacterium]